VIRVFLIIVFLTLLLITIQLLSRKAGRSGGKSIKLHLAGTPFLFLIFLLAYILLVIAVIAFFDSTVQLDNRILSPAYVAALILVLYVLHKFFHSSIRHYVQLALILVGAAFAVMYLAAATAWITYSHFNGRQYTNKVWQGLEISKELEIFSPETRFFFKLSRVYLFPNGKTSVSG
jgi:predicted ferric reductase